MNIAQGLLVRIVSTAILSLCSGVVSAQAGDRLLATGGVSQIEGTGGGGLVPWALITGYGTRDQIGASAYHTHIDIDDFRMRSSGVAVGIYDRVELSLSRQLFSLGTTVPGQSIRQDVVGAKVKLAGDAVIDQDTWVPQVSAGIQYKKNRDMLVPGLLGAKHDSGVDFYLAATKLYLAGAFGRNLLANVAVRATRANQLGILGFGGDKRDRYQPQLEASLAILPRDDLAVGVEYRYKPDNLSVFREDDFYDLFVAWFPSKHVSVTLAYAGMGQIADKRKQNGAYLSVQIAK
ncbi:MAG: DUF3034 family protein [Betaproteobacteria bacterium]|nr:DUF3034 family protein [Betaproteobacteria bacterium]